MKNNNEAVVCVLFVSQFTQSKANTKCEMQVRFDHFFQLLLLRKLAAISDDANETKQTKQLQSAWTKLMETKQNAV